MGLSCTFKLNGLPLSLLVCPGVGNFPAFSGQLPRRNDPGATAVAGIGPLPRGRYYIVERKSGGRLGWIYDALSPLYSTDRSDWFALHADDGKIDDSTIINGVRRGAFRLHPKGPRGVSEGCVTLEKQADFDLLRTALLKQPTVTMPGGGQAYGTIDVQ
jgi:hypothetical protein